MFTIPFSFWSNSLQNALVTGLGSIGSLTINGVTCNRGIVKINSEGSVYTTFNSGGTGLITGSMPIVCARPQSTGKIVCCQTVQLLMLNIILMEQIIL